MAVFAEPGVVRWLQRLQQCMFDQLLSRTVGFPGSRWLLGISTSFLRLEPFFHHLSSWTITRMSEIVNADPAELAKFSELAHRWWDPEGEFRPLHRINPLRLDWIHGLCQLPAQRVLDVGCGGGILAESMARKGADVTGIDLASKALRVARLHALEAQTANIRYREVSAEALAKEQPASFDMVSCMEMLEHVPDPASVVHACAELVKPGGWVFFSTINRSPKAFMQAIVGAEYLLNLLPRGTHEYAKLIRPSELAASCRSAGLDVQRSKGLEYNPLTQRYWLSSDTSVNYLFACRQAV